MDITGRSGIHNRNNIKTSDKEENDSSDENEDLISEDDQNENNVNVERRTSLRNVRKIDETDSRRKKKHKKKTDNKPIPSKSNSDTTKNYGVLIFAIFSVLILIIFKLFYKNEGNKIEIKSIDEEIIALSKLFPKQDVDIWTHFKIGIKGMIKNTTAIFLLLQTSNKHKTALNIAQQVGNITIRHSDKSSNPTESITLNSNILNNLKHGDMIEKYKHELEMRSVMIIENVEKVNPHVVQDLRYFCDEVDPCIRKSMIFLIMNVANCPDSEHIHNESLKIQIVERCFEELWKNGLKPEVIKPVLARIINVVININEET